MKRILCILALFLLLIPLTGSAKYKPLPIERPNLQQIKDSVLDPTSRFYFPRLQERFEANDTVMTPLEYRYFYLGYMFQEDYDPYRMSQFNDSSEMILKKGAALTNHEVDDVISYCEKALRDNPLDLRQMSFLVHYLKEKKKNMRAKFWEYRLANLLGAILTTGTGLDSENAWFVVYPMHEYDLLQYLGYQVNEAEYPADGIDRIKVTPLQNARKIGGQTPNAFYFDVKIPQQQYILKHPGED